MIEQKHPQSAIVHFDGETTITGKNQITLPAHELHELGWTRGDRLTVGFTSNGFMILMRKPQSWTREFAGRLSHVFGTHEETIADLNVERQSWEDWAELRGHSEP